MEEMGNQRHNSIMQKLECMETKYDEIMISHWGLKFVTVDVELDDNHPKEKKDEDNHHNS